MSFIHIGFLLAGAAAMTLPIWIHLLLRQKARQVEIGSVRFVQHVVRRTRNRQRIRRWLLLLLRCLAILLLGLLFARPYFPDTPADGSTREAVVLIDRSASMSAKHDDGQSALDKARARAREFVASLGDQARVHLGLFDASGVQTIPWDELDDVRPAATGTDFGDAFDWAADLLVSSPRKDRALLMLSDLQRHAVQSRLAQSLPPGTPIQIEDPAPAVAQNLAIESLVATQVELRPGVPIQVALRVRNHGTFPVTDVAVSLVLAGPDGSVEQQATFSLQAGEATTIELPLELNQAGIYRGQAEIDREDPLPWDNQRQLAFAARHPDRVLLVDGQPGRNVWGNETYFLETALRLRTAVGEGPPRTFEVERLVWDQGAGFPDLSGFRLIIMANVGRFTLTDAARLKSYLSAGGNVWIWLGERTTPTVLQPLVDSELLPGLELESARDHLANLSEFQPQHPALSTFRDPQYGSLQSLSISRLMPITKLPSGAEVLMRTSQWPLLISRDFGQGHVVLVATTADRQWSDWPQHRLFVPLVRQLAAWLTGRLDVRQPVISETIDDPSLQPGISEESGSIIVRNVDSAESDIRRFGVDQFRDVVGIAPADPEAMSQEFKEFEPEGVSRSDERWPRVVWCLLGILGIEILLASRVHE